MSSFHKATRESLYARIFIMGAAGDGKTNTGLRIAAGLSAGGKVFVLDTHAGQGEMYSGQGDGAGGVLDYMAAQISEPYSVTKCADLVNEAVAAGAAVILIDSLSDFWEGPGGILEEKAAKERANRNANGYTLWQEFGRKWQRFMRLLNDVPAHVIVTSRRKTEYELVKNKAGKNVPIAIGTKPLVRDGTEYEFDFILSMHAAEATIAKTRTEEVVPIGSVIDRPGAAFGQRLLKWLRNGDAAEKEIRASLMADAMTALGNIASLAGTTAETIQEWLESEYGQLTELRIARLRGLPTWLDSPEAQHAYKVWSKKRETVSKPPAAQTQPARPAVQSGEPEPAQATGRDELKAFIAANDLGGAIELYWNARAADGADFQSLDQIDAWPHDQAATFHGILQRVLEAGPDGATTFLAQALGRDLEPGDMDRLEARIEWAAPDGGPVAGWPMAFAKALLAEKCVRSPETLHLRCGFPKPEKGGEA